MEFVDGLSTDELEAAIDRIESRVNKAVATATKIYIPVFEVSYLPQTGQKIRRAVAPRDCEGL